MRIRLTWALALSILSFIPLPSFAAEPTPIELAVADGQVVGGAKVIRLKRDDAVALTVRSDKADELHVHGYNLHADVVPGKPSTLKFVAKRTGRFSMELHKAGVELGTLEIYPK